MSEDKGNLAGRRTPIEIDPEDFRKIGHRLIDDVTELLAGMRERPLTPGESPAAVRELLDADARLPEQGTDAATLLREATDLLVDHSLYNAHPRFFGYITAGAAPIGILGDLLASAVNPNVGSWTLAPMATEIEAQAVRWIAEMVGYPEGGDGVLVSGGNVANMLGFWAARAARAGWDAREHGMRAKGARDLRVYGSKGMHTWIQKAADLSGMGGDSIRWIDTDSDGRIDLKALRVQIEADVAAGALPMMVVGTGGAVSTGVVDPLPQLRQLCDEFGIWFHVDGAYGAFAAAAKGAPPELRGLSKADSVALDPHKWLYAPLEAGCALVRDPQALLAAFSYRPDYYHFEAADVENFFEHGLQNSRGFRALKVWLVLRHAGRDGYRRMIDEDIALARRFHELATEHPELEPFTNALSITTYRYVPEDLVDRTDKETVAEYLNVLNEEVQERMEKSGRAFVSNAVIDGAYVLRMCIVNFRTALEDVEALADISVELGREADEELRPESLR